MVYLCQVDFREDPKPHLAGDGQVAIVHLLSHLLQESSLIQFVTAVVLHREQGITGDLAVQLITSLGGGYSTVRPNFYVSKSWSYDLLT